MKSRFHPHRHPKAPWLAAGALALALTAWPANLYAGNGHGHGRGHGHGHHKAFHHVYVGPKHFVAPPVVHTRFVVPRVIYRPSLATYRPYYYGQVYYPVAHRYVAVYAFPVFVDGVAVYQPYAYDGGRLLSRGFFTAAGPRFSFSIGF